ncbi:ComEC/Rec2 family competence protein [Neorhizobium alkalisoli]|uniref:ComEC/Rec2 family competence protein n=1 Tax=Neorhizobium alkalisoli TaxID=528178 RepID=UPI000CFA38D4|nr:MBL fold metallo-hydrolase [Neorhizobium alkalisoli]
MKALWILPVIVVAGPTLAQTPDIPVNEYGEEQYGGDYLPTTSANLGEYYIGSPNAGVAVPDALLTLPQSVFPRTPTLALPADRQTLPNLTPFSVPLRKDFAPGVGFNGGFNGRKKMASSGTNTSPDAIMYVHYVDVGQGAGAILEFPCGIALIDVGGEWADDGVDGEIMFKNYLDTFFETRPYLDNTIDVVFLSHPHADHANGAALLLPEAGGTYTIKNVVDNGLEGSRGMLGKQTKFHKTAAEFGAGYTGVTVDAQVTATGVTNANIDPLACKGVDPIITAFWGGRPELANSGQYKNPNNHSVVVRVDFGRASFLFVGDLEDKGVVDLLDQYSTNPGVFDADVYLVSHHGADQETTDQMLAAVTPRIAVLSMGTADSPDGFTYGHPRITTLDALQQAPAVVSNDLPGGPVTVLASPSAKSVFKLYELTKEIYGTGWGGTIVMQATSGGVYSVGSTSKR